MKKIIRNRMKRTESKLHKIGTYNIWKTFLTSFDIKRYILDDGIKGTLMHIWKSANIFVLIWKYYVEDATLKHLLPFEIFAREIREKFVYKYSETIEYVKN